MKFIRIVLQKIINILEKTKNSLPDPTNAIDEITKGSKNILFKRYQNILNDFNSRASRVTTDKKNIIYIYEKPDFSTFRYRGYNTSQVINSKLSEKYSATFFFMDELEKISDLISKFSVVILIRTPYTPELMDFINEVKSQKIKLMYDIDDVVFDTKKVPELVKIDNFHENPLHEDILYGYVYRRSLIAPFCDEFITTNDFLKEIIEKHFNKKCYVIPNTLNDEQIEASKNLKVKKDSGHFTIGYFSGSSTHNNDFELISDSLIELMNKHKNIKLMIGGHLTLPKKFTKFKRQRRVYIVPFVNFVDQLNFVAQCDLNLIPLVQSDITNAKSELKFFEAAIVKVPSIASETFIYRQVLENEVNGILSADNEWKANIEKVYKDVTLRKKIATNAYNYSVENYYGEKIEKKLETFLSEIL